MERNLTSLNMNSEQRLNQFKTYIGKLDENVEKNMEYHKQYLKAKHIFLNLTFACCDTEKQWH